MTRTKSIFLAFVAVLLTPMVANADLIRWDLDNAVFDDGTSLIGSFTYDAGTDTFSDWDLSVFDGTLSAYNYLPGVDSGFLGIHSPLQADFVAFPAGTGGRYVRLVFDSALTDAGGYIALATSSLSWECDNCGTHRYIVSGAVASVSVPEPGTAALLGIGLVGLGLARWRRKV